MEEESEDAKMLEQALKSGSVFTTSILFERLLERASNRMWRDYPKDWYERHGLDLVRLQFLSGVFLGWMWIDKSMHDGTISSLVVFVLAQSLFSILVVICCLPTVIWARGPASPRWSHKSVLLEPQTNKLLEETAKAEWLYGKWICNRLSRMPMDGRRLYSTYELTKLCIEKMRIERGMF